MLVNCCLSSCARYCWGVFLMFDSLPMLCNLPGACYCTLHTMHRMCARSLEYVMVVCLWLGCAPQEITSPCTHSPLGQRLESEAKIWALGVCYLVEVPLSCVSVWVDVLYGGLHPHSIETIWVPCCVFAIKNIDCNMLVVQEDGVYQAQGKVRGLISVIAAFVLCCHMD